MTALPQFFVGDTIAIPLPGVGMLKGTVYDISLLRTGLTTEDGTTVSVPNKTWTAAVCYNYSRVKPQQAGGPGKL